MVYQGNASARMRRFMSGIWTKLIWGAGAAAAVGIGFWQYQEYQHESQLARTVLQRQAEALEHAVVGGIRSHRRLGRFIEVQIQAALQELVEAADVLAAAIGTADGKPILSAGEKTYLDPLPTAPGFTWQPGALVYVSRFTLVGDQGPLGPGPPGSGVGPWWAGSEKGEHGPGGPGPKSAPKYGRGRWTWAEPPTASESLLAAGGEFVAVLVLDRAGTDAQVVRAGRVRLWLAAVGMGLLLCAALAAWSTLRLLRARTQAQLLEMESRHLRDLSQAAAGLAHQTRHPLGLLRGWAQRLAQSDLQTDEARQRAQALMEECDRLTARLNQFLAFARPRDPEPEPVPLGELIRELEVLLQPDWEAKRLRFRYHPPPDGADRVEADRDMLRQALFNLVQNAIQASPEGGEIAIRLTSGHDGRCRLTVADQGPGVPEEDRPKLFSPYFTTREDGTGLGLAIVRRIATAHGWQVGYQQPGEGGSVFWMDGLRAVR